MGRQKNAFLVTQLLAVSMYACPLRDAGVTQGASLVTLEPGTCLADLSKLAYTGGAGIHYRPSHKTEHHKKPTAVDSLRFLGQ